MVAKLIFKITEFSDENGVTHVKEMLETNLKLHELITIYKNKITEFYNNKSWDKFKKISNEYEMIFTTPNTTSNIALYTPVSRSFFKMWEILCDFDLIFKFPTDKINVCMLCEGPGGFAEALIKYRNNPKDVYQGMSLKSNNDKNIPDWKFMNRINIMYGADGTGNLYNMTNIFHLVKNCGKHSMDLVTADGGFDFSSDFNNQEEMSMKLVYCEILTTLLLQKEGGSFILKIYDIFTEKTLRIIHVLKTFYKDIYIMKPLTSRPANSEKYLICTGFHKNEETFKQYFILMFKLIKKNEDSFVIEYDHQLLKNLIYFNQKYTFRQITYIQRTIDYINMFASISTRWLMQKILAEHRKKSIKWCKAYGIPSVEY